jgi:hypothetical protein
MLFMLYMSLEFSLVEKMQTTDILSVNENWMNAFLFCPWIYFLGNIWEKPFAEGKTTKTSTVSFSSQVKFFISIISYFRSIEFVQKICGLYSFNFNYSCLANLVIRYLTKKHSSYSPVFTFKTSN